MSQSRSGFFGSLTNCFNKVKNSMLTKITAGTVLVTSILVLDFVCEQKTQHENIDWNYYTETPGRIVWLLLSGLMQGANLVAVINSLKRDTENNAANRLSAQKVLAATTLYTTSMAFANFSLTATPQPLTEEQWGILSARAILNGSLGGLIMSTGNYFLNKLNFSIRPITLDHVKFISAGIIIAMLQELLGFVCDQMIKQNSITWDELTTPIEPFAWQIIVLATTGTLYGIEKIGFDKYANPEDGSLNLFNKIFLPVMAVFSYLASFTQYSLTIPINSDNAGYIAAKSLTSIPSGLTSGAGLSIFMGLLRQQQLQAALHAPLLEDATPHGPRMRAGSVNNV